MQVLKLQVLLVLALSGYACTEANPYKDQGVQTGKTSSKNINGNNHNAGGGATVEAPVASVEQAKPEAAPKDAVPPVVLSAAQIICADKDYLGKYPLEMAVFCLNGQPTTAFANALNNPFRGTGQPTLTVIKAEDVDEISTFILVSSIEVPKTLAATLASKEGLNRGTLVGGPATMVQTEVLALPASGDMLAMYEINMDVAIAVGGLTVDDNRVAMRDYVTLKEGAVVKSSTYLKANVEDNEGKVSNVLSWMISEGAKTKMVGVTHQQADNRGRHEIAVEVVNGLGRTMVSEGFKTLSK